MPLWDSVIARKKRAAEILSHKLEWDNQMLDAQSLTMHAGKGYLLGIMIAAIIKRYS